MTVIDAHQHFWQYHPERHSWINEDMAVLKRDFLPSGLQKEYAEHGVDGCIAVQADQSEAETFFLLELAEHYDFIKGVVGWADLCSPEVEQRLAFFAQYPRLCGFRHILQDEPDANFMLQDSFQQGIGCLGKYGFAYDILIFPAQMEAALQTIKNFPDQRFVIDHLAKPYIRRGEIDYWERNIRAMAVHENVYCKVSGMVTEADWRNWQYASLVPYLDVVFDAFGCHRILFGSDWPVCLLAGSYKNVKSIVDWYTESFSREEKAMVFGGNALRFYKIPE